MKKLKLFLLVSIMPAFLMAFAKSNYETVVIKTNIFCDHCKECESCGGKIEKDLGFGKGIRLVKLDEQAMTITVTYNPKKTTIDEIRKSISKYGYDADEVKANPVAYEKLDECCKPK